MARNEEKAMTMLNRWYTQKKELGKKEIIRPQGQMRIQKIDSLNVCEKWRNSITKEVSKLISKIQNAGLGEYRIRELNDEINQKLKEKKMWDHRIAELGGTIQRTIDEEVIGTELEGNGGYKYFGAAKDLPGVRELFQQKNVEAPQKQGLTSIFKTLNFETYLGNTIENESEILEEERRQEEQLRKQTIQEWLEKNKEKLKLSKKEIEKLDEESILQLMEKEGEWKSDQQEEQNQEIQAGEGEQKTQQQYLLDMKKQELLSKVSNMV